MSYQSPVLIEFTPRGGATVELVPVDGWLVDLPQFAASQQLFELDGVIIADAFFKPIGGATVQFELSIEIDKASLLIAQNAFLGTVLQNSGELSFVADAWRLDFPQAAMSDATPGLPADTGVATYVRTLSVTAGIPVYTLTP